MAFLVGASLMMRRRVGRWSWLFLDVKHTELATDEAPEGVHVG